MKKIMFSSNSATNDDGFWVSDEDYERVNERTWCLARATAGCLHIISQSKKQDRDDGHPNKLAVYRFILGVKYGDKRVVDHVDGNRLNNTRENLRICTPQENTRNRKLNKNSSTGYKGVTFLKKKNKYVADIRLGSFNTAEEAHKAYCDAAAKMFGEFARFK